MVTFILYKLKKNNLFITTLLTFAILTTMTVMVQQEVFGGLFDGDGISVPPVTEWKAPPVPPVTEWVPHERHSNRVPPTDTNYPTLETNGADTTFQDAVVAAERDAAVKERDADAAENIDRPDFGRNVDSDIVKQEFMGAWEVPDSDIVDKNEYKDNSNINDLADVYPTQYKDDGSTNDLADVYTTQDKDDDWDDPGFPDDNRHAYNALPIETDLMDREFYKDVAAAERREWSDCRKPSKKLRK